MQAKGSNARRSRQFSRFSSLALLAVLALPACDSLQKIGDDFVDLGRGLARQNDAQGEGGFKGAVAVDEPRAALAGSDILAAGGNAFDAAAAIYFTLAVTLPSKASLGGGGVCITHDAASTETKVLEFLGKQSFLAGTTARRPSAVPGNVRGFYALHSRYGRLPWPQLIAPAEGLARFGGKVSRALSHDLATIGDALLADPNGRRIFSNPSGAMLTEGDAFKQVQLAEILGSIRENGADAIYSGAGAESLAASYQASGGALNAGDLRDFLAVWRNAIEVPLGDISVHFTAPPAAAGAVAAEMWAMMTSTRRYQDAPEGTRPHLFAEAALRAYADRTRWLQSDGSSSVEPFDLVAASRIAALMADYNPDAHVPAASLNPPPLVPPEDPAAATFVVVDSDGAAVACALTTNGLFGNGGIAGDSGVLMASIPGQGGRGPLPLGPMLAVDHYTNDIFFAGAAAGGVTAPTALMSVALGNLLDIGDLEDVMAQKRIHLSGDPDLLYYEQGYDEAAVKALIARGHRVAATPTLGLVNAIGCTQGLPYDPASCQAASDPRGFGLALKRE
ncbi:MAG: gamma-glutamyltransferase [Rhodospirillaceae bacterium]|nr:gamma-glutamyltransferase [Rhodospirillaceae bacterium]